MEFDRGLDCDQIGDQIGDQLGALWAPLHAELDHACLNDIQGLENPTSEVLSHWLWDRLKPELPALSWVTVYETATAGCHFDGTHYRIWKERRFESALRLALAPEGDPRRRLHGHSYLLRLHLTAPLDDVLGWTVDYGDVKALFQPVYRRLDHHRLDELADLPDPDPGRLTLWMREALAGALPALDRIDLHETPGCGAVLCWGDLGPALPT
jgi:6-pyruvoyltetrahydropterin/6-carboxytetrahydropterin synthase